MTDDPNQTRFLRVPEETNGLLVNLVVTLIFFVPNFALFWSVMRDRYYLFMVYNFVMIFILFSIIIHYRFR